jgi:polysaccharide biosynthesis/export protein
MKWINRIMSILIFALSIPLLAEETGTGSAAAKPFDDYIQFLLHEGLLKGIFTNDSKDYVLGKGDVVEILVRGKPEFSGNFVIGPDGKVQYPFFDDILAEGLTKHLLTTQIATLLQKFINNPEVGVRILQYRSKYIYILGEVNKPGKYYIEGDAIYLRDAIIQAGLPTQDAAIKRVRIIKTDYEKPVSDKINLKNILYKGKLKENKLLVSGDLVVVPSLIHSDINRFLVKLLDPILRVAILDDLVERHK